MSAAAAFAQDNAKEAPGPGASQGEIVVTGTRRNDLKAADSAQPIDIITGAELLEKGTADMNDLLRTEVPSLNVQRLVSNDGAVFTRPFSLRGLPPDQTLVLVNGKRRHRGATVQFTNVPYIRGSQGPDLSAIPSIAIGQLEVLRDGASALYGSDAIAGVLNFGLRRDREGGLLIARYGQFYKGDGEDFLVQGNVGLPFTDAGFVNISGEYVNASTTSRWGNPESEAARIFVNAGIELSDEMEFYTFGNYSWSRGTTAFFYRNPDASFISTSIPLTNTPGGQRFSFRQLFPGGFTPDFGATVTDAALAAGLKGEFSSGLTYDLSASYGQNHASYRIENTVNPSLGLASPTSFKPGQLEQRELAFNLDLTYPIAIGTSDPLTLAGGLEYRRETYEITAGDIASWQVGPFASVIDPDTGNRVGLPVGSNGFPGFSPIQAGEFARSNWAAYTSLEGNLTDALQFGLAGRYENYSDFGSKFTWKINGRYDFSDVFAVRGSVNTGFRAPTPGQSNASQVQTNIDSITGAPLTAGIIAPNNPVAQFFGATPLRPENSFNVAGGIVVKPSNRITFTLDYFNIKVEDRIAVSGNFNLTPAQRAQLAALGIPGGDSFQQVSFFTNSFDSRTQGVDAVLTVGFDLGDGHARPQRQLYQNRCHQGLAGDHCGPRAAARTRGLRSEVEGQCVLHLCGRALRLRRARELLWQMDRLWRDPGGRPDRRRRTAGRSRAFLPGQRHAQTRGRRREYLRQLPRPRGAPIADQQRDPVSPLCADGVQRRLLVRPRDRFLLIGGAGRACDDFRLQPASAPNIASRWASSIAMKAAATCDIGRSIGVKSIYSK
jgi:iron complex outermembrane receptor protein